ncbi:hypothetical protein, partial [Tautonia marina]|uniref:hypothetical protein n=1 Tax=Tautonia marina TaxID=2653855 RepID=UPI001F3750B4
FRIPFNIQDPAMLEQIAEVHLYVSSDRGLSWEYAGNTAPDQLAFPYRAPRDGEYWFAVRTRDRQNRLYPPDMEQVRPKLRVVVDTTAPSVVIRALPRRAGVVGIVWEVKDEYLDLSTFALEYQVQGAPANAWRQVRTSPRIVGEARWEVGTGLPVTVRVTVADSSGNRGSAQQLLPDGLAEAPGSVSAPSAGAAPPPILARRASDPSPARSGVSDDPFAGIDDRPPPAPRTNTSAPVRSSNAAPPARPTPSPSPNPAAAPAAPPADSGGVRIIASPRFPLSYGVEDASVESLEVVEMWVTRDNGQTWESLGTDPDRRSPFHVDLGGDGRHGLRIVVQSQNGLGDPRPVSGTPAEFEVIVDTTPPRVALDSVGIGSGDEAGSLVVEWRTDEPHPAETPIVISIRPDAPDAIWQQITPALPDSGRFVWPLPPNVPARFHVRLDVFDVVGNQNAVETSEPIVLDIPRPRGRILGLDPSARVRSSPVR